MTLETFATQLEKILTDFYAQDPGWRHDPLWLKAKALQQRAQAAVDQAADDANEETFQKWQAAKAETAELPNG